MTCMYTVSSLDQILDYSVAECCHTLEDQVVMGGVVMSCCFCVHTSLGLSKRDASLNNAISLIYASDLRRHI